MSTEHKWKRGDIGPDGRVFWSYKKGCKNGEWWITQSKFEEQKQKMREQSRKNYAANPQKFCIKAREKYRICHAANPEKFREMDRKRRSSNIDKFRQRYRKYRVTNRDKIREKDRKKYAKKINQAAADQFFIMAGAAESISQLK